jgi:aspartate-semialdehyde dehydrogenase
MLRVLEEHKLDIDRLLPVASAKSVGKTIVFNGKEIPVVGVDEAIKAKPKYAIFSAGGATSLELAPRFAAAGIVVVDNSSAWRMDPSVPLVVPEVNPAAAFAHKGIIANPNCSTIQMVVALQPLHAAWGLRRVIVSTYQSVTGSGQKGKAQLEAERAGDQTSAAFYPHQIDLNLIPHIDSFTDGDFTKEEVKMMRETRKIMGLLSLPVAATTVRVPVMGGHSESVMAEFESEVTAEQARAILSQAPGVIVYDNPAENQYPMPLLAEGRDEVWVGRIRQDPDFANTLHLWVVADNLRKGAATNAVQIIELLERGQG